MESTDPEAAAKAAREAEEARRIWMRRVVTWTVAGIVGAWLAAFAVAWLAPSEDAARFGDTFGVLNTLFSGLALAGVIVAILLQREELRLQRKELEETRAELKRQADAAEASQKALEKQRRAMLLSAAMTAAVAKAGHAERAYDGDRDPTKILARLQAQRGLDHLYFVVALELDERVSDWEEPPAEEP